MFRSREGHASFIPSQRRIRRMTKAFRRKWSEAQIRERAGFLKEEPWQPPLVEVKDLEKSLGCHMDFSESI